MPSPPAGVDEGLHAEFQTNLLCLRGYSTDSSKVFTQDVVLTARIDLVRMFLTRFVVRSDELLNHKYGRSALGD